ncbi:MAG: CopG family transcriptional regulator [Leptolyngbyaceae cyanobacterium RU_5_1]|nr:CopG family transcriptional regulator [Leptolyngbyaceae cyanobacterium RU_5_1]
MTRKTRKPLSENDSLANEFVFGATRPVAVAPVSEAPPEPVAETPEPAEDEPEDEIAAPIAQPQPKTRKAVKASQPAPASESFVSKLMDRPEKEPTIRLTVDLPESMHKKLSLLSARSGKKKAVIVRMLLEEALEDVAT